MQMDSGDDTDFSLSEFPPTKGFDHLHWPSSFQASVTQLQSEWWGCLTTTRNAFLTFHLYTRLIAVCLIKADQALQMGNEEDLAIYKYRTLPVLEYFSQQCTDIARQITNNFSVLTGIVDELTETCTVASGQAGMTQRELRITEQVNTEESESTEAEIKEMIEKRKRLVESIQKAEEEFAKIVLELPGAFNIMTTTAVDRCTSTLHNVSRFFRKATEKIMKFDIFGFFNTCEKELKEAKDMVVDWFQGVKDDSEDPVSFGEGKTGKDEELAKEMIMYIKVMEIKAAVDFMTQTLLEQGSLKVQKSTIDTVWETEAKLGAKMRALKKGEKYAELESIVTSLLNVCQNILGESKSMSTSEETYNQVLNDLLGAQESLELMSKAMKHKLDSVAPEESKSSTEESPKQSHHRGFMVLERIADERFARGRKLQIHLRRYDSETDNISSLFEVQKETAGLLSQLTAELTELGKALDHMSQAATSLTNLQRELHGLNVFTQQVATVIQIRLAPKVDQVAKQMTRCLENVKKSKEEKISRLQQDITRKEIREACSTAKTVYESSKAFVAHCYP